MSTLRSFEDRDGTQWEVWEAHPEAAERRRRSDRREMPRAGAPVRRHDEEGARAARAGWLVFRTGAERRRHIPIPERWEALDTAGLRQLLHAARPSGPRSRIVG